MPEMLGVVFLSARSHALDSPVYTVRQRRKNVTEHPWLWCGAAPVCSMFVCDAHTDKILAECIHSARG